VLPAAQDFGDLYPHLVDQAEHQVRRLGPPQGTAIAMVAKGRGLASMAAIQAQGVESNVWAEAAARVLLWTRAAWDKASGLFLPREYREARERLHDRDITDFRPVQGGEPVVLLDGTLRPLAEAVERSLRPPVRLAVPALPAPSAPLPAPATPVPEPPPEPQPQPARVAAVLPPIPAQVEEEPEDPKAAKVKSAQAKMAALLALKTHEPPKAQPPVKRPSTLGELLQGRAAAPETSQPQPQPLTHRPGAGDWRKQLGIEKAPSMPQETPKPPTRDDDTPPPGGGTPGHRKDHRKL
jgi:hypothetical protein